MYKPIVQTICFLFVLIFSCQFSFGGEVKDLCEKGRRQLASSKNPPPLLDTLPSCEQVEKWSVEKEINDREWKESQDRTKRAEEEDKKRGYKICGESCRSLRKDMVAQIDRATESLFIQDGGRLYYVSMTDAKDLFRLYVNLYGTAGEFYSLAETAIDDVKEVAKCLQYFPVDRDVNKCKRAIDKAVGSHVAASIRVSDNIPLK